MKNITLYLFCLTISLGCAAMVPSIATSEPSQSTFKRVSDVPKRVNAIGFNRGIFSSSRLKDAGAEILRAELSALGFTIDDNDPEFVFMAGFRRGGYSFLGNLGNAETDLSLKNMSTGEILWNARSTIRIDLYSSAINAMEATLRKTIKLLRNDLRKLGFKKDSE